MKDKARKHIYFLMLALLYLFGHGLLVFLSGVWWDDWCNYNLGLSTITEWNIKMGRPETIPWSVLTYVLPKEIRGLIVFALLMISAFFLFRILVEGYRITHKNAFVISALYSTLPYFDIRIMECVFPYVIGIFFFSIAYHLFVQIINGKKQCWYWRALNLILFVLSYTLNSLLVLYILIPFYILFRTKKISNLMKYADYMILPIAYYIIKSKCFPPYAEYAGYNQVTNYGIKFGLTHFFEAGFNTIASTFNTILKPLYSYSKTISIVAYVAIGLTILFVFIIYNISKRVDNRNELVFQEGKKEKQLFYWIVVGFMILCFSLFPYTVIRLTADLQIEGIWGRDTLLCGIGMSIIVYALFNILFKKKWAIVFIAIVVTLGTINTNVHYIDYQIDYYNQIGFQLKLSDNGQLKSKKNIVCRMNSGNENDIHRFYTLNANAQVAFGDQTRFMMTGWEVNSILQEESDAELQKLINSPIYHMQEYALSYKSVDAEISFSSDLSRSDVIKLKIWEIFDHDRFIDYIREKTMLDVVLLDI